MSRKLAASPSDEVKNISKHIFSWWFSQACIIRARGFLWGTTSDAVRTFFSDSKVSPHVMKLTLYWFNVTQKLLTSDYYLVYIKVEAVNFLDDLHGECYVELKSKEDLVRALDKHALRVGTRLRRRLIEVYLLLFDNEFRIKGNCRCTPPHWLRWIGPWWKGKEVRQLQVGGEGREGRRDWREGAWVEVELVEVGQEGEGADLLPGAWAGAADGVESKEVALMKTTVTQISRLEVEPKVARSRMNFLTKEFLTKEAVQARANLAQERMRV